MAEKERKRFSAIAKCNSENCDALFRFIFAVAINCRKIEDASSEHKTVVVQLGKRILPRGGELFAAMTKKYIGYTIFQAGFNAVIVWLFYLNYYRGAETEILIRIAAVLYIPILAVICRALFPEWSISYKKMAAYFVCGITAALLFNAAYLAADQLLASEEKSLYPFKAAIFSAGTSLCLYQSFLLIVLAALVVGLRDKMLCRSRRTEYLYWLLLLLSVHFTAFHSYGENIKTVYTGEFNAAERVYVSYPDVTYSNINIMAASILAPAGLSLLILIMLHQMQSKSTGGGGFLTDLRSIRRRFSKFCKPTSPGYVGDPIGNVVACTFTCLFFYAAVLWLAGWVKGGYVTWAIIAPASPAFYYAAKRYNSMRQSG